MNEDALIWLECPNCGKRHADSPAHVKAHWDDTFSCEDGCGIDMKFDRDELRAVLETQTSADPLVIRMHKAG